MKAFGFTLACILAMFGAYLLNRAAPDLARATESGDFTTAMPVVAAALVLVLGGVRCFAKVVNTR